MKSLFILTSASQEAKYIQSKTVSSYLLGDIGIISLQYVIWDTLLPPTSTPWSPSCPCPPSPCSSRWWWVRAKSLPVQTFLPGGRVFNKVFQSQESIDQYVAFLLLINPQLWRKWRYNSGFKSSVRSKSDLKSHQLLVIIVHRRGKKIYMCGLLIRKNKWSCVEEK